MSPQRRCEACDYTPLSSHTSIRPPPWLPTGNNVFYVCRVCGSITIQSYDNQTSYGQLWLLEPGAMALLRTDASPREVTGYLSSDDFLHNRVVTEGLFQTWIRGTLDISMCVNDIMARARACVDPRRLDVMVAQLNIAISEVTRRRFQDDEIICRISTIEPLFMAINGGFPHAHATPELVANVRLMALDTLEDLAQPWMWQLVPTSERDALEAALDHATLLEHSREEVALARQRMHSDGPLKIREECLFLQGIFARRDAHLTVTYASLLWGCLRDLYARMGNANSSALQKVYDLVQELLEAQVIELGLEPVTWRTDHGASFHLPKTGEVIHLRRREPQVEIYQTLRSSEPTHVFDAWFDVLEWIRARNGDLSR